MHVHDLEQALEKRMKPVNGVRITVTKHGPYFVDGRVPLSVESIVTDAEGESESWRVERNLDDHERCGLCRGAANRPG